MFDQPILLCPNIFAFISLSNLGCVLVTAKEKNNDIKNMPSYLKQIANSLG